MFSLSSESLHLQRRPLKEVPLHLLFLIGGKGVYESDVGIDADGRIERCRL